MSWGEESDRQGVKFKETVLPPGFREDPQEEVRGLSFAPPETKPAASAPRAAWTPRSVAVRSLRVPPKAPNPVRTARRKTTSVRAAGMGER